MKLTTDGHRAWRGICATAEPLVFDLLIKGDSSEFRHNISYTKTGMVVPREGEKFEDMLSRFQYTNVIRQADGALCIASRCKKNQLLIINNGRYLNA